LKIDSGGVEDLYNSSTSAATAESRHISGINDRIVGTNSGDIDTKMRTPQA